MAIVIKRYLNRKLYNTQSKRYITLEEIEELIKDQEEVRVVDNQTGNDITAITLSQIIFELEKNREGFLPHTLLLSLVQSGGKRIEEIRRNVFNSLNLAHHFDNEIERRVNQLISDGQIKEEVGNQLLEKLLSVSYPQEDLRENIEARITELLHSSQMPTKTDLQALIQKIDDLTKRVDDIHLNDTNDSN